MNSPLPDPFTIRLNQYTKEQLVNEMCNVL